MLSLLYGWFGEAPGALLDTRLAGIALGATLGIAASWLILPVRTGDVLRKRSADALSALGGLLAANRTDAAALRAGQFGFDQSLGQLARIAQPLRAQRLLFARCRPASANGADAIDAIAGCAGPVRVLAGGAGDGASDGASEGASTGRDDDPVGVAARAVARNVVAVRQVIGRRSGGLGYRAVLATPEGPAGAALGQLDRALGVLATAFTPVSAGRRGGPGRTRLRR